MHLRERADATTKLPLPPRPKVVNASGDFDGNDGKWSSFIINVNSDEEGLSGQNFKTLISTSSSITLLPAQNEWCDTTCAKQRGVLTYNGQQVKGLETEAHWELYGLYDIPLPYWYKADIPGPGSNDTFKGLWAISNVGLGESSANSPVLAKRYIASYTFGDFFMGSFGLAVGEVGQDGSTTATFLSQFVDDSQIASSSYGYTAGAYYRNNALGSLVLGGYDKSRMTGNSVSVSMLNKINTTLAIGVQQIVYAPDQDVEAAYLSFTNGTSGFSATIDSTLPYLVLPEFVCNKFRDYFGLEYDEDQNLYFVNSSSHASNKQQNATVTFSIGADPSRSGNFVNIILPYAAFDQQIGSRTGDNLTDYFPIKKSKDGVNVLGRTFLQEAYIVVDYERANFTVAPAFYSDPMPSADIKIILNTTYVLPGSSDSPSSGGSLSPGAIAGIVVGIVLAFVVAGVCAFCLWRKRKNKRVAEQKAHETSQIDPTQAGQEIKHRRVSELTGSDIPNSPKTAFGGYYTADHKSIPPISEMSPDSPPVELYSPPPESASDVDGGRDYFTAAKPHRRGAQRDRASSGHNSPGTPIAELPGDEGQIHTPDTQLDGVSPLNSPLQNHGPSNTSLSTNIDERLAGHKKEATQPDHTSEVVTADKTSDPKEEAKPTGTTEAASEQRPLHQRGLSDTTIASDSTAVSQPTSEEEERWAREPRRPLSG